MKTKFIILGLLVLTIFGCKNNELEISPKDELLNFIKDNNTPKKFKESFSKNRISFTLDLGSKSPQVIHISSDHSKLPFMVLCKVSGAPHQLDESKFVLDSFDFAIRSIGTQPQTFFKLTGRPTFQRAPSTSTDGFQWHLNLDLDLNRSRGPLDNSSVLLTSNNNVVKNGELVDIHINPEKLIASLESLYESNQNIHGFDKNNINEYLQMLCCAGVVCETKLVIPKP